MRFVMFLIVLSCIIPFQAVHAVQLDAVILNSENTINPSFKFLRVVYIECPEGGKLKYMLNGKDSQILFTADKNTSGVEKLIDQINQDLKNSKSSAVVTDLNLQYHATLSSNQNSASIEYDIKFNPVISEYVKSDDLQVFVDSKWRGFAVKYPIIIDTEYGQFDLNSPRSALDVMAPQASSEIGSLAKDVLDVPLIDASGLNSLPLTKWHYLFDPTGQQVESQNIGYKEKGIFSRFSMGECNISTGICNDRQWKTDLFLDKEYVIRAVESQDDATLSIQGYVNVKTVDGIETFEVSPKGDSTERKINEFPAGIIYGMTILAVIGAVIFFVFSSRRIKKEAGMGQTGIDPSLLYVQETSSSAGSYKTNRGEAHISARELPNGIQKSPVRYQE